MADHILTFELLDSLHRDIDRANDIVHITIQATSTDSHTAGALLSANEHLARALEMLRAHLEVNHG